MSKKYTNRLLNIVEPYKIGATVKTAFYTDKNCNFEINDRVFITFGHYDSKIMSISIDYEVNSEGYKVLFVDRCKIVLDIDFTGELPYESYNEERYIRIYNIDSQREFDYINQLDINVNDNGTITRMNRFVLFDNNNQLLNRNLIYNNSPVDEFIVANNEPYFDEIKNHNELLQTGFCYRVYQSLDWIANPNFMDNIHPDERFKIYGDSIKLQNGDILHSGLVYKYNTISEKFEVDINHCPPVVSRLIFRGGVFKGNWNDGLFGTYEKRMKWDYPNAKWNSGYMINTDWVNGVVGDKSQNVEVSYYAHLDDNGSVVTTMDNSNNLSFGYNTLVDCTIVKGEVQNGILERCTIINSNNTNDVLDMKHQGGDLNNFSSDLLIHGGKFIDSYIENTTLRNATIQNSTVYNSYLHTNNVMSSKVNNSYFDNSIIGDINNSVTINNLDIWGYKYDSGMLMGILKLYIPESDFVKFDNLDTIYLTYINKEWVLENELDVKLHIPLEAKYYFDTYFKKNKKHLVKISNPLENRYQTNLTAPTSPIVENDVLVETIENPNPRFSIDIELENFIYIKVLDEDKFVRYIDEYLPASISKENINRLRNSKIDTLDIETSLIDNSDWKFGSYINEYDNYIKFDTGSNEFSIIWNNVFQIFEITLNSDQIIKDSLKVGDYVYLNNIQYNKTSSTIKIDGNFIIDSVDSANRYYQLKPLVVNPDIDGTGTVSLDRLSNGFYNVVLPTYLAIDTLLIRNSKVSGGYLDNVALSKSVIIDNLENKTENLFFDLRVKHIIFKDNENIINGGHVFNSHVFNTDFESITLLNGGIVTKSIIFESENNGSTLQNITWYNSIQNSGLITQTKNITLNSLAYDTYTHREIIKGGTINNGAITKSFAYDLVFRDGTFVESELWSGEVYGGLFGDKNIDYRKTKVGNLPYLPFDNNYSLTVLWYNGTAVNSLIGGLGKVHWYNGFLEGGEFTTNPLYINLYNNFSIWYNGEFSGSTFSGFAKWKDGKFKNGKFISIFKTNNNIIESTDPADYAWEDGIFYGEIFGTGNIKIAQNSSWFKGKMYGGLFQGSVWNNGVLYSGKFIGSGLRFVIDPTDTTLYYDGNGNVIADKINQATADLNELKLVLENSDANLFKPKFHKVDVSSSIVTYPSDITNKHSLNYSKYFVSSFIDNFYGLWKNGIICDDESVGNPNEQMEANNIPNNSDEKKIDSVEMLNVLFMDAMVMHQDSNIKNSVFLKGTINNGELTDVVFNPYVNRTLETDENPIFIYDNTAVINGGRLNGGIYYISDIKNTIIDHGVYNGVSIIDSVANYSWSNNIYWKNSKWVNGNYDGSPFSISSLEKDINGNILLVNNSPVMTKFTKEIIDHINDKKQLDGVTDNGLIHINNHITNQNYVSPINTYPFSNTNIVDMYRQLSSTSFNISQYTRRNFFDFTHRRNWILTSPSLYFIDVFTPNTNYGVGSPVIKSIKGFRLASQFELGTGLVRIMIYDDSTDLSARNLQTYRQIEYDFVPKDRVHVLDPGKPIIKLDDTNVITTNSSTMVINNVYYESPRVPYSLRNLTFKPGGNFNDPTWDYTEFRMFSANNDNYKINNSATRFLRPQTLAPSNNNGSFTFTNTDVFRILFTEYDSGLQVKYQIKAKLRYAISHTRPITSTVRQPISTRIIAGRKKDPITGEITLNQIIDTFTPNDWDWVGEKEYTLEYSPIQSDIYKGALSSEHVVNKAKNNTIITDYYYPFSNEAVQAGDAGDFDKELTIDVYTNNLFKSTNAYTIFNANGSMLYDIFQVYLVGLTITTSVSNYSAINNTLWTSFNTQTNDWLLPTGTIPSYNTSSIKVINNVRTVRQEVAQFKFGNGRFMSGMWIHGAWNQGWRDDNVIKFYPTLDAVRSSDNQWFLQLNVIDEENTRLSEIKKGDKVAVSNIIGIDKNDDRSILSNYALVVEILADGIIVQVTSESELITVKPDSDIHLIYVTRNVWLNGVFFNGYFKGIFNYGMIKGFPNITKVENTHMISGVFDGGHFLSNTTNTNSRYKIGVLLKNSNISQDYNASLIQNFTFYDNNYSSNNRFIYNSWLDLDYDLSHKSVFFDDTFVDVLNSHTFGKFNVADTNGYVINDILSSTAYIRETKSQKVVTHNLGTKGKIINTLMPVGVSDFSDESNVYVDIQANTINVGNNSGLWAINSFLSRSGSAPIGPPIINPFISGQTVNVNVDMVYLLEGDRLPTPSSNFMLNVSLNSYNLYLFKNEYYVCFRSTGISSVNGYQWSKVNRRGQPFTSTVVHLPRFVKVATNLDLREKRIDTAYKYNNTLTISLDREANIMGIFSLNNNNIKIDKKKYTIIEFKLNRYAKYIDATNNNDFTYLEDSVQIFNNNLSDFGVVNLDYHPNFYNEKWYIMKAFGTGAGYSTMYQPRISFGYLPNPYSMNQSIPLDKNGKYLERLNEPNYEYFYNKTDLNMYFYNATSVFANFDYIKMHELSMIPFYRYTNGDRGEIGINNSVVTQWLGIANINFNSDLGIIGNTDISRDYLNDLIEVEYKLPLIYKLIPNILNSFKLSTTKHLLK